MFWLSVRQFRGQAVVVGVLLAAFAAVVLIVGFQVLAAYHADLASCAKTGNCGVATAGLASTYSDMADWLNALALVVPGLLGIFWGAPLLARELETGTFRLAWSQSVSRTRWTLTKLVLVGLAAMAAAGLCSWLVTWWSSPLDFVGGAGPFSSFDVRGIVPIGYAAFAFSLGVAAGAVLRRTVPAMGATLVAFVAVRLAFKVWVRQHLITPLVARNPFSIRSLNSIQIGPGQHAGQGAWVISQSLVNAAGQAVKGGPAGVFNFSATTAGPNGVSIPGMGSCPNLHASTAALGNPAVPAGLIARCINQLHLTSVTTYEPANRYWPIQGLEMLCFFVLALAVGAFTVWWVRHLN